MNESPSSGSSDGSWIIDVDAQSFERAIILRSRDVPVIVDFWATWCEPCRALGPLLERRAREGRGRFLLAKVDVDRSPELAQAFRVQGIPAVLAVVNGRLVDGFQGALPEPELDEFLERIAPVGARFDAAAEARERAAAGDGEGAVTFLREHLRQPSEDHDARIALAELLVDAGRVGEARRVFEKLPEDARASDAARSVKARIDLAESAGDLEVLRQRAASAPEDAAARAALGAALVAHRQWETGLEELLEAVRLDPDGADGRAAKETMRGVFEALGLEDPLANAYRFRLQLLLFA
jgi:putative thioredoxin